MNIELWTKVEQIQLWKYALPFSPFNWEDDASQTDAAHSVIRIVILLLPPCHFSPFPFHLINKDTISWASCHLPCSTHLRLSSRIQRAFWLGLFPFPAPIVRLGNSNIHDDALTTIPYPPKLSLPMTFYLYYQNNFLLCPCSITTPNQASSEILNLQPRNPILRSGCLSFMPLFLLVHLTHWQLLCAQSLATSWLLFLSSLEPVDNHCSAVRSGLNYFGLCLFSTPDKSNLSLLCPCSRAIYTKDSWRKL